MFRWLGYGVGVLLPWVPVGNSSATPGLPRPFVPAQSTAERGNGLIAETGRREPKGSEEDALTVLSSYLIPANSNVVDLPRLENPLTHLMMAKQAEPSPNASSNESLCPEPALSRLTRHRITSGETLASISQRYNLIPATLMGMNPVLRNGEAPVGADILIPPYNGIRVEVPTGKTWRDIAELYGTRADVLFEINGCQPSPRVVFVPGINWSPNSAAASSSSVEGVLSRYPLPETASITMGYGWQLDSATGNVAFHSGVDLSASTGTPVTAVGDGTVAFAANQGNYGNLVVINHSQGLQTRYAQLDNIEVRVGQVVRRGQRLGTVGQTGLAPDPHLHFEVRSNSDLGWVAQDPANYFEEMNIARQ